MRERLTFVHLPDAGIDPTILVIDDYGIDGPGLISVREQRLLFSIHELSSEVNEVLQELDDLHVRWSAPTAHNTLDPFSSRVSPGLHVAYTPRDEATHSP